MSDPIAHNTYVNEVCNLAKAEIEANPKLSQYDKKRILSDIEDRRKKGLVDVP